MLPSLIATDLDGTLLTPAGEVSPRTVAALDLAHELAVPIVISTGRPVRWLANLQSIAHVRPEVICSNGAVRYDLASGQVIGQIDLPIDITLDVADRMRHALPTASFGVEFGTSWGCEPGFSLHHRKETPDAVAPLADLLTHGAVKLLVVADNVSSAEMAEALAPAVASDLEVTWSYRGPHGLLEVGPPGVTKATALVTACQELDADPHDAVAFGDMPNDLAMLRMVGQPVVMGNADPRMLVNGFRVAPPNDANGVAEVLFDLLSPARRR